MSKQKKLIYSNNGRDRKGNWKNTNEDSSVKDEINIELDKYGEN